VTIGGALQFGASLWLWGIVMRVVLVRHVTWCGNSFPHCFGSNASIVAEAFDGNERIVRALLS
jgi:fatty-acid desaturase